MVGIREKATGNIWISQEHRTLAHVIGSHRAEEQTDQTAVGHRERDESARGQMGGRSWLVSIRCALGVREEEICVLVFESGRSAGQNDGKITEMEESKFPDVLMGVCGG